MGQIPLSTSGKEILNRNPFRRSIIFHNPSSETVWIERTDANGISVTNASIRMPEGALIAINWLNEGADGIVDQYSAIAESGTPTLVITEFVGRHHKTTELERALAKEPVI
jgi:hypothetical protein